MSTTSAKPKPPRIPASPEVLTLVEAAAYLRVSEGEVLRMIQEQRLPGRLIGKEWRFSARGLQDWLREGPSAKERLMRLAGAWKDDPHLQEIVGEAYRRRGRSSTENGR
jgi:excisionase family DNA binding protein